MRSRHSTLSTDNQSQILLSSMSYLTLTIVNMITMPFMTSIMHRALLGIRQATWWPQDTNKFLYQQGLLAQRHIHL